MIFLIALIAGFVGALPILFSKSESKVSTFVISGVFFVLLGWLFFYAGMPSLAYPLGGWIGAWLFILFIASTVITFEDDELNVPSILIALGTILIIIGFSVFNSAFFRANDYANLIGNISDKTEKHWTQDTKQIDPTNIRLVPPNYALSMAKTVVKDGSQYQLSHNHITLQKIDGKNGLEYVYLIPLDFTGFLVWANTNYVPGYVKVSATDPYAVPKLYNNLEMKYTPGAYFSDNLERILYNKYPNKILTDYSFESDDNGNIFYVVTVCHPSIGYNGTVVDGVIIVDPQTGKDNGIIPIGSVPSWVDRVIPEDIAIEYINLWGLYKNGWGNSWIGKKGLKKSENVSLNYSSDNKCVYAIPVTSTNNSDHSMLSIMYMDTRTGAVTNYTLTDNGGTEDAIIGAVNAKVSYKNMHASGQVVYENVYGTLSALVPVLGQKDNYEGLAIVETANKRVAFGETPVKALAAYQKILMERTGQIATDNTIELNKITEVIYRMGWEFSGTDKAYYLMFKNNPHSFQINSDIASELSLTKEGDLVEIKYIDSKENTIPTTYFHNLTLSIKSTPAQDVVIDKQIKTQENRKNRLDVNDLRNKVNDMSDEDVLKLIKDKK